MAYLAQHPSVSEVVGIDGIRKALVSFQNDNPVFEIQSQNDDEYHDGQSLNINVQYGDTSRNENLLWKAKLVDLTSTRHLEEENQMHYSQMTEL